MSYVAKREKVFARQDPKYPDCTPPITKRSDHRLKRFQSAFDKRAWDYCDEIRYKHFYDLMSGSQTCIGVDQCHRYVPLEDLIKILMAEKDALIKQLQERLQQSGDQENANRSPKDKSPQETRIEELTQEVNKSRDMLRQAMHKLENIDEIVNENKKLQCRLRCSEERVKFLEEKKKHLEIELADLRSKSQIQIDLEKAQQMLSKVTQQREDMAGLDEAALQALALERDKLQEKVQKLEKELEESKKKEKEIEMLRKQSESDSFDKEEMSRENECYRKKLASMKCLEKQIQELKKQGRALADKHKREAQRAAEQMNKMSQAAKELQCLREERDSLRKRVNELSSYECQYNKLQRKLQRVDAVIAENENLNSKLMALQKLEKENEYLRCRLEAIREMEMNAAGDKERIMQLQCAVADQEEEMKDLLCQIERLTSGKHEEELERLKCELYEKNSKLKLCEEQLAEIPMLEAEIDELRMKLQCCCREFSEKKTGENYQSYQKMEVRFPASKTGIRVNYKTPGKKSSSVIGIRRELRVELKGQQGSCQEILPGERGRAYQESAEGGEKKDAMSCEEVQSLLHSSKGIISCVLEDMIEHQKEMEKLEMCNKAMKEEIEILKNKVGGSHKDNCLRELDKLKRTLEEKDLEICRLRQQAGSSQDGEDIETLRELNQQMKAELEAACAALKQAANLENMLETERRARCEAEYKLRDQEQSKSSRTEPSVEKSGSLGESSTPDSDYCKALQKEVDDLKLQIVALKNLTEELKKENELLRELQQPCPDFSKELDEKCALENLLSLLQAELDACKGQKLNDECEALRNELKRVIEQNCQLKALVDCYRERLDLEKKSNELTGVKPGEVMGSAGGEERDVNLSNRQCEQELKALRDQLSKVQQQNADLKKYIEESGLKIPEEQKKDVADEMIRKAMDSSDVEDNLEEDLGKTVPGVPDQPKKEVPGGEVGRTEGLGGEKTVDGRLDGTGGKGPGGAEPEVAGPKGAGPEDAGPKGAGPEDAGPKGAGPEDAGPKGAGPEVAGPKGAEPEDAGPKGAGPEDAKPKGPGPEDAKPKGPGPEDAKPKGPGPEDAKPKAPGPEDAKPKGAGPEDAKPKAPGPEDAKPKGAGPGGAGTGAESQKGQTGPGGAEAKAEGRGSEGRANKVSPDEVRELQDRIKQLEAECEEKLRKLMQQHEKELGDREKAYNDNLNAMKSGYEADIRKLADRHKQSIMRLQELHEDEVQELNLNYESQLDAMQTQSQEAVKDVAKGSAAKMRKLTDQHMKDIKNLENQFHEALTEKESQYKEQLGGLRSSLTKSMQELEELKKKDKARGNPDQLKAQHAREMQKLRRTSLQKINAMKEKLEEERKKSEAEVESLKRKLKDRESGDGVCTCNVARRKPPKVRDPTCPLDFNEVLEKILEEGLDSLTFNEIALVHRKTCCALEGIVMKSNASPVLELEPPVGDGCPHTPLLEADKQQLLSRIFALENDIIQKQKLTQEAIIGMEVAIKKERCRLQEVRNLLESEQQKNSKLKLLLNSQTKLQADLKKERDLLENQASVHQILCEEKTKQLDEEVKSKKSLEAEVELLKNKLRQLSLVLETERKKFDPNQDQIEQMRLKLEQTVHQEHKLALRLEDEIKYRMQLQCQLQTLRQSFKHMVNLPAVENDIKIAQNPLEAKSAKEKQNLDQIKEKKNKIKTKPAKKNKK